MDNVARVQKLNRLQALSYRVLAYVLWVSLEQILDKASQCVVHQLHKHPQVVLKLVGLIDFEHQVVIGIGADLH